MHRHGIFYGIVIFAVLAGFSLAFAPPALAQLQRPRLGGGIRGPDQGREKPSKGDPRAEGSDAEPAEQQPAETLPGADSYHKGAEALAKGDTDAAIALLNRAIQLDPKYAPAYCDRGLALVFKGELDKAIADLDAAIRLAPGGGRSYFNRGFAYFQKGDYDKAIADYTEAIRLHPDYAEAYRDRGYVRTLTGDVWRAIDDLNFAVRLAPKDPAAYTSRGKAYSAVGDWDFAIADFSRAIEFSPKGSDPWCERSTARAMKGDFDGAVADAEQAMKLTPNEPVSRFTRGFAFRKKGELDKAMADFNEAIRLDPEFSEARRERAKTLAAKGEWDKAMADLDEAIRLLPEDYDALLCRGDFRAIKGDLDPRWPTTANRYGSLRVSPKPISTARCCISPKMTKTTPWPTIENSSNRTRERPTVTRIGAGPKTSGSGQRPSIGWSNCCKTRSRTPKNIPSRAPRFTSRANWTRPSPSTIRRWSFIRATSRSITIAGWPFARRTIQPRPLPTTRWRFGSTRSICPPMPIGVTPITSEARSTGAGRFQQDTGVGSLQRRREEESRRDSSHAERRLT